MLHVLLFSAGLIIGSLVTQIIFRVNTGSGYFTIQKIPDEEDFYTVNVRLGVDQKLNKKTRIILKRE